MNQIKKLRKSEKEAAIKAGILQAVADETGYTVATVSRTLHGKFDRLNPEIVSAIERFLAQLAARKSAA